MLVIITRTMLIYLFLLIGLRLMGKRQLGELQPFEFVITLAVADLACTPMQDIAIPIAYGLVPLFTIFVLHYFITALATKSIKFRRFLNGRPVIVINEMGIDASALKKLNMNVNDLLESIRGQQIFSIEQIKFAVIETNGTLNILENTEAEAPSAIPITLIVEGRFIEANYNIADVDKDFVTGYLKNKGFKAADITLMTKDGSKIFLQPKYQKYFTENI